MAIYVSARSEKLILTSAVRQFVKGDNITRPIIKIFIMPMFTNLVSLRQYELQEKTLYG